MSLVNKEYTDKHSNICSLCTLRKEKTVVTQTYQIITKNQRRNKLIIYMITHIHKSILYQPNRFYK